MGIVAQGRNVEQGARRFLGRAGWIAVAAVLAGCAPVRLFNDYTVAESADVAALPWPRLVAVPAAPPPGQYGPGVPDPTTGAAVAAALSDRARAAEARRAALGAPVITPAERAALARP